MKGLTLKKAIDLSVLKWEYIESDPCVIEYNIGKILPELKDLNSECGMCEYYWRVDGCCDECPLKDCGISCCDEYNEWHSYSAIEPETTESVETARYWATKLLNRLYELRLCLKNQR